MKIRNIFFALISLLLISFASYSQDVRSLETRVTDLLARTPAKNNAATDKLMEVMLSLGDAGINRICEQVIPPGTGDDTSPRFAVESLSRFVSQSGKETEKESWEKICISYAINQNDPGVKDFFMKQLQLIGGVESARAMSIYLVNSELCNPALAVISAVGGKTAETILAESLKNKNLPCAAGVMNALALMNSQLAVKEYLALTSSEDISLKAASYNALARSGSPLAYQVLLQAAESVFWKWEPSGAAISLINYADCLARNGDLKTMDNICNLVISACNEVNTIQNKIAALTVYVKFHGALAMPLIIEAASTTNSSYRNAAMQLSLTIKGSEITEMWIKYFRKAISPAKPEIIAMLGTRADETALPLIKKSLTNKDLKIREASAAAIIKVNGRNAIPSVINYMKEFDSDADQQSAKSALMSVITDEDIALLLPVLNDGSESARKTVIELIAWKKDQEYFSEIFSFTASKDEPVRNAVYKALATLAGPQDMDELTWLLGSTEDPENLEDIRRALAEAANQIAEPEMRSDKLIFALSEGISERKIIPILAETGGRKALDIVWDKFKNGTPEIKDVCFKTLTNWKDYSASYILFEICASGNKAYEKLAFEGYVRQVASAEIPDEQKLLLYRKIMPFAGNPEDQNKILIEVGNLHTYQTLYFLSEYLDKPSTSAFAAKSAMNIALPSADRKEGMYGGRVKVILIKAAGRLTGPESEYEKERINKYLTQTSPDEGFIPMFNGRDLEGWQGLVENPITRSKMTPGELSKKQTEADKKILENWSVKDNCIWFNGEGDNLCSVKEYGNFEMTVDWKISKKGDSGIYLRGSPQVQIWDTSRVEVGAQVGSGGLYNNLLNPSKPLVVADNPVGDWNTFRILMTGEKVSVWLNGLLVADRVTMENYWDRNIPIFPKGPIELQAHGTDLAFRDIYIREINEREYNLTPGEKADGFVSLFNGKDLDNWVGNKESYIAEDAMIVVKPAEGSGGNLYTEKQYSDFIFRFEFQLTPAANNGLGIRTPLEGDAAYVGMEIQILDNTAPVYNDLKPYQYHGSVYGVIPAKKGFLNPVGEWNYEEVVASGSKIKVVLNGNVIVDGDISGPRDSGTLDHNEHPGLKNAKGHIGFLGHGSELKFRNIRLKELQMP
jgi:HEAT repeat protein